MPEVDEFGIPVRKKESPAVDEFGIPIKKKVPTVSNGTDVKTDGSSDSPIKDQQKPLDSSGQKDDGVFRYEGRKDALYKKSGGKWLISPKGDGNFVPLKENVEQRTKELNAKAKRVYNTGYDEDLSFQEAPGKTPIVAESIGPSQEVFQEDFYVLPKKGMSREEQIDFISTKKAKEELGETADPNKFKERKQYYANVSTQKNLRNDGYDVDVNGNLDDPKTKKALLQYNTKEVLKQKSTALTKSFENDINDIITSNLIGNNEEQVVKLLNKRFAKDGFSFEETGLGDAMVVRYSADNGATESEPITIDLDAFFSDQGQAAQLKQYMKSKYIPEYEKSIALGSDVEQLQKNGADQETIDKAKKKYAEDLLSLMGSNPKKFGAEFISEDVFNNLITDTYRDIRDKKESLSLNYKELNDEIEAHNLNPSEESLAQISAKKRAIDKMKSELFIDLGKAEKMEEDYKKAVGHYTEMKGKEGNFLGAIGGSFVKGFASAPKALANVAADVLPHMLPYGGTSSVEYEELKRDGLNDAEIKNHISSKIKRSIIADADKALVKIGSLGTTTQEFLESEDRSLLENAINGLSESVGTALSGGGNKTMQALAFFSQSYNNMEKEMSAPEFDDMSLWEKKAISVGYGIVIGQLEKLGFNTASGISKNPLVKKVINNTLLKSLKDVPKDASIHAIEEAISNNLKSTLVSSGIKIVSGALAEGGTEASQTLAEVGIKNIVNSIHEKDYFQNVPDITTPEGLKVALGQAMEDGLMGAIGGAVMSSYDAFRSNRDEKQADSKFTEMYESLSDPALFKSVKMNVGIKLKNGQITKDEARSELNSINDTKAKLDKIPSEYSIREKRVAYNLLTEKEALQTKIAGKDPLLVTKETDRIKAIDEELKSLKPNTDAVQVDSAAKVLQREQEETGETGSERAGMEQVQQGKTVTEESPKEEITLTTPSGDEVSISPEGISVTNLSEESDVTSLIKDALFEARGNGIESFTPLDNQEVYDQLASEGLVTKNDDGTFTINETAPDSEILTEKTNLGKVYDFLDNIDKSLGEFTAPGKLNDITGVLPAKTLQVVVKALKVSVEAGMTLEQAIKDYASKNKMDEKQITNSLFSISDAKERKLRYKVTGTKQPAPKKTEPARVAKEISKKNVRKIVVDEVSALKDQIRLEAKAALEKKKQVKDVILNITRHIRETKAKGNVSIRKMNSVINRLNKVDMDSQKSIDQFIEYVDKTLMDSEYAMKLDTAMSNRKRLKRVMKNARNEGKFIAKAFSQLNPNWVDNIDKYNEVAETLYNSIKKSRLTAQGGVSFKSEEDFEPIKKYIAKEQELQTAIAEENLRTLFDKAYGENESKGKTIPEMRSQMSEKAPKNESTVLSELEDKIDSLSEFIDVDAPDVIKRAAEIDVRKIDTKLALQIIDAIDSYVANGRASGINKIMAKYQGVINSEKSTLTPRKSTRLFGSKKLAKYNNTYLTNLNIVLERIFKGVGSAAEFTKESGWTNLVNDSNKAETEVKTIQNEYLSKFKKVKKFQSIDNIVERGVIAFLSRTSINENEFDTRKKLLLDSVDMLRKEGDDNEVKKAGYYEKVFKKLDLDNAISIDDVISKSEKSNVEAVQFITEMWQDKYDQLSDHAFGFHDIILSQDMNYNPDKYSKLVTDTTIEETTDLNELALMRFTNMIFDKNEAGVLMENTKPKTLPKGRYVDLDFDSNTFRAFEIALVDLYTAEDVAQLQAYTSADKFKKLMSPEDRAIIERAMSDYQLSKRNKLRIDEPQLRLANKLSSALSHLGSARSLAGIGQIPTQWTTAQFNTMVNTGVYYSPGASWNKDIREFIKNSGRAIANRGLESVTTIEQADDLITGGNFEKNKVFEFIKKANDTALRWTLSKPDVTAAYDAWWSYYKKSMAKQKLPIRLDELNDQAADYAQSMVDRNMDISDSDLRGRTFRSKASATRLLKQILLPFSTFTTNQKNRMWNDISVVMSNTSSNEDKVTAAKSLSALAVEAMVFNAVRYQIAKQMILLASSYLGLNDDEEEEFLKTLEKQQQQNAWANAITDVVSPNPVLNDVLLQAVNKGFDLTGTLEGDRKEFDKLIAEKNEEMLLEKGEQLSEKQIESKWEKFKQENEFRFYVDEKADYGLLGIEIGKAAAFKEMLQTALTGEYTTEYEGRVSNKIMTKEGREAIKIPVYMKGLSLLFPPREVDQFASKVYSIAKKKYGMSEDQYDKLKELKKRGLEVSDVEMPLIKSKLHMETIAENLSMMNGLSDEDKKSYIATIIK